MPVSLSHVKSCDSYIEAGARMRSYVKSILFIMNGVCCLTTFQSFYNSEFKVQKAHFHVESIKASPVMIACKMAKVFTFFYYQLNMDVL